MPGSNLVLGPLGDAPAAFVSSASSNDERTAPAATQASGRRQPRQRVFGGFAHRELDESSRYPTRPCVAYRPASTRRTRPDGRLAADAAPARTSSRAEHRNESDLSLARHFASIQWLGRGLRSRHGPRGRPANTRLAPSRSGSAARRVFGPGILARTKTGTSAPRRKPARPARRGSVDSPTQLVQRHRTLAASLEPPKPPPVGMRFRRRCQHLARF